MSRFLKFLLCMVVALSLFGCSTHTSKNKLEDVKEFYGPAHPEYKMDVTYNNKKHKITGSMTVAFTNNLNKTLKHIYFNLWPNSKVFGDGGIKVDNVRFNDKPVNFKVKGTLLDLSGLSFKEGESGTIKMDFTVTIPKKVDRFGWSGTNVTLGNWFPILAVYDNQGWNLNPYYDGGESFYSLTGDFDVSLKTDDKEVVAATGQEINPPTKTNGQSTYHFQAKNVRDFAMVINSAFKVKTENEGPTKINVYYTADQEEHSKELMATGHYALKSFNVLYGDYPWPELDIVDIGPTWFAGMEYPQLVMISIRYNSDKLYVYNTTEHEIAHQWFYGVVGNNEYRDPWLDESFATYSANAIIITGLDNLERVPAPPDIYHVSSPVSVFEKHKDDYGGRMYSQTIYFYGAKTLNELREKLGDGLFYKGMQAYFEKMKFKIATTRDFIKIMEDTSGKDLSKFFDEHHVYASEKDE